MRTLADSAVIISLQTAGAAIVVTFFAGVAAARFVAGLRSRYGKMILDGVFTLPLVLPPTVVGFFLLLLFGVNRPLGQMVYRVFGYKIAFSWGATVLAAAVVSFPLMYRAARGAFEQVDGDLVAAARTLGLSERRIFWRIVLPTALPGVAGGAVLAFARGMGEFGATTMIAGNIAGKTRTLPLAVYSAVAAGDMDSAYRYVLIIMILSFAVVAAMNFFLARERRQAGKARP
ncbi:MAG: molybdate ABC transporter permease subunit [Planctomycetes bacterium]|nr:molybdate ABC transporter permease subunit [Planctomycetota bacterium]